jgi:hypothetical protein
MNMATAGVSVRPLRVTIATGEGLSDSLIGSSQSPYRSALSFSTERGNTAIYWPPLATFWRRCMDDVATLGGGGFRPLASNASVTNSPANTSNEASPQTDEACGGCGSGRRLMTSFW